MIPTTKIQISIKTDPALLSILQAIVLYSASLNLSSLTFFYSFRIEHRTYTADTMMFSNDIFCHSVLPSGHRSDEGEEPFRNVCTFSVLFRPL